MSEEVMRLGLRLILSSSLSALARRMDVISGVVAALRAFCDLARLGVRCSSRCMCLVREFLAVRSRGHCSAGLRRRDDD